MGFGDFDWICKAAPIPLCASVGSIGDVRLGVGIEPECYARNIELANTIIFQGATSFMHIIALIMTIIMVLHVRSKFTAVGRKEIGFFFYLYMVLTFISLLIDAGVVPPGSEPYSYFVAIQNGLTSALCACLMINGFVGFQLYEDGTSLSLWILRGTSALFFALTFLVSLGTFKSVAGMSPTKTIGMFIMLYLASAICLAIYIVMQIFLVLNTLEDRWPLGDICIGTLALAVGQIILYAFSNKICGEVAHYFDGLFIATICNLLAVMMVYKYWDSITKEDLEFSVTAKKNNNWEVKGLLPGEDEGRRTTIYQDTAYADSFSNAVPPPRNSNYGGFNY